MSEFALQTQEDKERSINYAKDIKTIKENTFALEDE